MKKQTGNVLRIPPLFSLVHNLTRLPGPVMEHFAATDVLTTESLELHVVERIREVMRQKDRLQAEKDRYESLIYSLLPRKIAIELVETGDVRPARYENVSVLFADFVDFTRISATITPASLVQELNDMFETFDEIVKALGLEKIKTTGDSYMAVSGLPETCEDHAMRCVRAAIEMLRCLNERNQINPIHWNIRVGIHSGPVIAGIIGKHKFTFDLWGDTVNTASRMESNGMPGTVNISAHTHALVCDQIPCMHRGKVRVKGKGDLDMYYVKAC